MSLTRYIIPHKDGCPRRDSARLATPPDGDPCPTCGAVWTRAD